MNKKFRIYIIVAVIIINILLVDINIPNYFKALSECFNRDIPLTTNLYIVICFIIALISVLIILDMLLVVYKQNNENKGIKIKNEDGTYGTSNWMNENEMSEVLSLDDKPGIILGKYNNKLVKLPFESNFNKNMCVFGSSGSMKTIRFCTNKYVRVVEVQEINYLY